MSSLNLQAQSAPYTPSEPSKTGRLDVTWSGGVGSIDYGTIATSGGGKRRKSRKSRKSKKSKKSKKARKSRRRS